MEEPSSLSRADTNEPEGEVEKIPGSSVKSGNYPSISKTPPGVPASASEDTTNGLVRVFPVEMSFDRPGSNGECVAVKSFTIQNAGRTVRSMRLSRPISNTFKILNPQDMPYDLAPGLRCTIKIQASPPASNDKESENICDRLIVQTDCGDVTIPLVLYGVKAKLIVPAALDFGHVVVGKSSQILPIRNIGPRDGSFTVVQSPDNPFQVQPAKGVVAANSIIHVRCEAPCDHTGILRGLITIQTEESQPPLLVDVSATVVDQALEILEYDRPDQHVREISFGRMYFGDMVEVRKTLLNNSPHGCTFKITVSDLGGAGEADVEMASSGTSGPLMVSPREGVLEPYSELALIFRFKPKLAKVVRGFRSKQHRGATYDYRIQALLEAIETGQSLRIDMTGKGIDPDVLLSHTELSFGSCPVNSRLDASLKIENRSADLALPISFNHLAHFRTTPSGDTIPALQARDVHVSFVPKQLGRFQGALELKLGNPEKPLRTIMIPVQGIAPSVAAHKAVREGVDLVAEDFEPDRNYIEPTVCFTPPTTPRREKGSKLVIPDYQQEDQFTFSASQFRALHEHKAKYNSFLSRVSKSRQKKRSELAEDAECPDDDISLGMPFAQGMQEPDVAIPDRREPLWLQYPMGGYPGAQGRPGGSTQPLHDESRRIEKKFKPAPSTQAEMRDCSQHLSMRRLTKVSCGPSLLDFGNVCINSSTRKTFSVVNNLQQHIRVALSIDAEELANSTPLAQVIPPSKAAGFDIVMSPSHVQDLRCVVGYIINNQHHLNFTVQAEVTPMELQMSSSDLIFSFSSDSLEFTSVRRVVLHNPCAAPAHFRWDVGLPSLQFLPEAGTVPAYKDLDVQVLFNAMKAMQARDGEDTEEIAVEDANIDHSVKLIVTGGEQLSLQCFSKVPKTRLLANTQKADFGVVAVGAEAIAEATLTNDGHHAAVFQLLDVPEAIDVRPRMGRLQPGQDVILRMRMRPSAPTSISAVIRVVVRGGKSINIEVFGESVLPELSVLQDEIDFGGVTLGGRGAVDVSIRSDSRVPTVLYLDLSRYTDFSLNLPAEWTGLDATDAPITPVPVSEAIRAVSGISTDVAPGANDDAVLKGVSLESGDDVPRAYRITIKPGATQMLPMVFTPVSVSEYAFPLPLFVAGLPSYGDIRRVVHAEGLKPKMVLSESVLDFGERIVLKPNKVRSLAYRMQVTITNDDIPEIEWFLEPVTVEEEAGDSVFGVDVDSDVSEVDEVDEGEELTSAAEALPGHSVWSVEPVNGMLSLGETGSVTIRFAPLKPGDFEQRLGLFLGEDRDEPYLELLVKGSAVYPMLRFDVAEVALPVVPLGMKTSQRVLVSNCGYDSLELRCRLPQDEVAVPIVVDFPDGTLLGHGRKNLPVVVSFQSTKPMCFAATLDFLDADNNRFPLPVSACADNCMLSVWPFLLRHKYAFKSRTQRPTMIVDGGRRHAIQATSLAITSSDNIYPSSEVISMATMACKFLASVNLIEASTTPETFPEELVASEGRQVIAMVEFLSGKSVAKSSKKAKLSGKPDTNTSISTTVARLTPTEANALSRYEQLYVFLKANGALLSSKPEHLLHPGAFVRLLSSRSEEDPSAAPSFERRAIEKVFPMVSRQAWLEVLMQVIKVFLLRRVTAKRFRRLPGMDPSAVQAILASPTLVGSNIFSLHENLLLSWLEHHHNTVFPDHQRRVANFDSDLVDSVVLGAAILAHNPYLQSCHGLDLDCRGEEPRLVSNAQRFVAAIEEGNFQYAVSPTAIVHPKPREMVLLVMFLFETLPSYIPKAVLEFAGGMHVDIIKAIELTNPSKKPISYDVRIDGSPDFKTASDSVTLGGRSSENATASFEVTFRGRFSKTVNARLLFAPRRHAGERPPATCPKPLLFELRSRLTECKPLQSFNATSRLYELQEVALAVKNPFERDVEFNITIAKQWRTPPKDKQRARSKNGRAPPNRGSSKRPTPTSLGSSPSGASQTKGTISFPNAFSCEKRSVKIARGETENVPVQFLPFQDGLFTCEIVLIDERVGEIMIEVKGITKPPEVYETIKIQCKEKTQMIKEVLIPARNSQLERARAIIAERASGQAKVRAKEALRSSLLPNPLVYQIHISSPFIAAPKTLTIVDRRSQQSSSKKTPTGDAESVPRTSPNPEDGTPIVDASQEGSGENVLRLSFQGGPPGQYPGEVILRSEFDVRVLSIECTSMSDGTKAELEFQTAAGQPIKQQIPIVNNTDSEWRLSVELTGQGFSGLPSMTIEKNSTAYYQLQFLPLWMCTSVGKLVLFNPHTKENYVYTLKGEGQEPLATENVTIACRARERVEHTFKVSNRGSRDIEYRVESDLAHVFGPSTLLVKANATAEYTLTIAPQLGGIYNGSLTLMGPDNRFQWFAIEIKADSPEPESTLSIKTHLRKAIAVEIRIANPLDESIVFDVHVDGDDLFGDPSVSLGPKASHTYTLLYAPLRAGNFKGSVSFVDQKVGEFWYELDMEAERPLPVELEDMECEAGCQAIRTIVLENPTDHPIMISSRSSNPKNFTVKPATVKISSFKSAEVQVVYTPSSIGEPQNGELRFSNAEVGEWVYKVKGIGRKPTAMEPIVLQAAVRQRLSGMVHFRNPFEESIRVHVSLIDDERGSKKDPVFQLFLKRASTSISGLSSLQIPFFFTPYSMTRYQAQIMVRSSAGLKWTFPLIGEAEVRSIELHRFTCAARGSLERHLELPLDAMPMTSSQAATEQQPFTHEIRFGNEAINLDEDSDGTSSGTLLRRALTIHQLSQHPGEDENPAISFELVFEPLRPFTAQAQIILTRSSGGRWTFDLLFEATEPKVDDIIRIEAAVNHVSSVSFRLTNQFDTPAPFKAFFTPDSPYHLSVQPTEGLLDAYGGEGTQFIVSFAACEYGKPLVGRLVIQTAHMQWSYEVRGTHPHYSPPQPTNTFSSFMDARVMNKLHRRPKRNFMKDNIRASRSSPRRKPSSKK